MGKYKIKLGDIELDCDDESSIELTEESIEIDCDLTKESHGFKYLIHHDNGYPIGKTVDGLNTDNEIIVTAEFYNPGKGIEYLLDYLKTEGMFISRNGNIIKYKISANG